MSIHLHIDTLVLDGLDIQPHQAKALKEAVEAVLTHQLMAQASGSSSMALFATSLASSGTNENQPVNAGSISISPHHSGAKVGEQIGNAIYRGIQK